MALSNTKFRIKIQLSILVVTASVTDADLPNYSLDQVIGRFLEENVGKTHEVLTEFYDYETALEEPGRKQFSCEISRACSDCVSYLRSIFQDAVYSTESTGDPVVDDSLNNLISKFRCLCKHSQNTLKCAPLECCPKESLTEEAKEAWGHYDDLKFAMERLPYTVKEALNHGRLPIGDSSSNTNTDENNV